MASLLNCTAVHFKGPMQELMDATPYLVATKAIFPDYSSGWDIRGKSASGDRVAFIDDFICCQPIGVCRTAELVRFEDGLL